MIVVHTGLIAGVKTLIKNACRMPSEERKELSAVSTAIYGIYDNCGVVEQRLQLRSGVSGWGVN
jgi:hypothetical protein